MKSFQEVITDAKNLPTHVNGELQELFTFFKRNDSMFFSVIENDVISIFNAVSRLDAVTRLPFVKRAYINSAEGFYLKTYMTYRDDGTIRPKSEWETKLYYHKAWGRTDKEVKEVTYEIIGMKRKTTNLPAAVLISNVKFITD